MSPAKAFAFGVLLAGVNPKNLALTLAAATGLAQLGATGSDAVVALVVFVIVASLTIALPGGLPPDRRRRRAGEARRAAATGSACTMPR